MNLFKIVDGSLMFWQIENDATFSTFNLLSHPFKFGCKLKDAGGWRYEKELPLRAGCSLESLDNSISLVHGNCIKPELHEFVTSSKLKGNYLNSGHFKALKSKIRPPVYMLFVMKMR